jgi:hypothetical protein
MRWLQKTGRSGPPDLNASTCSNKMVPFLQPYISAAKGKQKHQDTFISATEQKQTASQLLAQCPI